jgi:hypothetical protein
LAAFFAERLGMDPRVKPEDDEGEDAKGALPPMR